VGGWLRGWKGDGDELARRQQPRTITLKLTHFRGHRHKSRTLVATSN
jgi:hypothetical protein